MRTKWTTTTKRAMMAAGTLAMAWLALLSLPSPSPEEEEEPDVANMAMNRVSLK